MTKKSDVGVEPQAETKYLFTNIMETDPTTKVKSETGDCALTVFLSGPGVPAFARGKLFLNVHALSSLLKLVETPNDDGVILRKKPPQILGNYDPETDRVAVMIAKSAKPDETEFHDEVYFDLTADLLTAAYWLACATRDNHEEGKTLKAIGGDSGASVAKIVGLFGRNKKPAADEGQQG